MSKPANTLRRIFGVPALIAVVSLIGLVAALLGDGPNDWISWIALGVPLVAIGWAWARRNA